MKPIATIACCSVMLAWTQVASAAAPAPLATMAPSTAKKPMVSHAVRDRAAVEQRMEYSGNLARERSNVARRMALQPPAKQ